MAKEENASSGLSYRFLAELADEEALRIELFEDLMVREGYRVSDHGKAIERDQRKKARGFRALAKMVRHVAAREFGVFTKGGMQ